MAVGGTLSPLAVGVFQDSVHNTLSALGCCHRPFENLGELLVNKKTGQAYILCFRASLLTFKLPQLSLYRVATMTSARRN